MILSNKRITKVLIRLRGCAGWSAPLLFANPEDRVSRIGAQLIRFKQKQNYTSTQRDTKYVPIFDCINILFLWHSDASQFS